MQILVLLGMYFDALVVFVTSQTLLFRLALAILWSDYILFFSLYYIKVSNIVEQNLMISIQLAER